MQEVFALWKQITVYKLSDKFRVSMGNPYFMKVVRERGGLTNEYNFP